MNYQKNGQISPLFLPKYPKTLSTIERVGSGDYWNDDSTRDEVIVHLNWENDLLHKGLLTERIIYSSNNSKV